MAYQISVVMPALNEEGNIVRAVEDAVDAFERLEIQGEIVVVNDGSRDRTPDLVRELQKKYPFVQLITHTQPMGVGRSFWDGVQAARGEVVTMLPGDAENDGFEILRYLPLMQHVDLVVPWVFNQGSRSFKRQVVSKLYRGVINLSFGTNLNYMNGTVMYRRNILKGMELQSNGFFYQTELLIKCLRAGYLYSEVPYGLKRREGGASKAISLKSFTKVAKDYLRTFSQAYFSGAASRELAEGSLSKSRHAEFASPSAGAASPQRLSGKIEPSPNL